MKYQQEEAGDIFAAHRASWEEACAIGNKGRQRVDQYLRQVSYQGRVVWTSKGTLSAWLQKTLGDALFSTGPEAFAAIELKTEVRTSPNLFLETWSNKSRGTPGWLWTLQTDLLCYYFLDSDRMYFVQFEKLRDWMRSRRANGEYVGTAFPEKRAGRRQLNDTWGRCVPLSAITMGGPGYYTVSAMQLEMFAEELGHGADAP